MPSARQFAGSRFIALADVIDKEPLRELIEYAKAEEGRFGKKLVLYSRSGLKLSLNKSSAGVLCRDIDEDYDAWSGFTVEVFAGQVQSQQGLMDAVQVRVIVDESEPPAPKSKKANPFNDDIEF
jgi:hypothetical protein